MSKQVLQRRVQMLIEQLIREEGSQRAAARKMGVSQPQVSMWRDGRNVPIASTIEKIAANLGLPRAFFWDETLGDALDYHRWQGKRVQSLTDEPREFLEWEAIVGPTLRPPLQPHERAILAAARYHRGALEKYSRHLRDLRDGLSEEEILAESKATADAQARADELGVPRRKRPA